LYHVMNLWLIYLFFYLFPWIDKMTHLTPVANFCCTGPESYRALPSYVYKPERSYRIPLSPFITALLNLVMLIVLWYREILISLACKLVQIYSCIFGSIVSPMLQLWFCIMMHYRYNALQQLSLLLSVQCFK
jgi:hypothetical protein